MLWLSSLSFFKTYYNVSYHYNTQLHIFFQIVNILFCFVHTFFCLKLWFNLFVSTCIYCTVFQTVTLSLLIAHFKFILALARKQCFITHFTLIHELSWPNRAKLQFCEHLHKFYLCSPACYWSPYTVHSTAQYVHCTVYNIHLSPSLCRLTVHCTLYSMSHFLFCLLLYPSVLLTCMTFQIDFHHKTSRI